MMTDLMNEEGNMIAANTMIEQAREVLRIEAEGILGLVDRIDRAFVQMVEMICSSRGRVIVSGIGKSGIVGRKIVATLNSTGTRSLFLHPVEAMHGDLGMVSREDIFLALSNSGETDELNILVPSIRRIGCKIIAFTGKPDSTLGRASDLVIDVTVAREACPLGLAPTASSTAILAMGDALAVVLINQKHFNSNDFKRFHPGGHLGQRLQSQVRELMLTGENIPQVNAWATMAEAISEMNRLELGAVLILAEGGILAGILTDGDLRRLLSKNRNPFDLSVTQVMSKSPHAVQMDALACDALNLMEKYQITVLPIVDPCGVVQGVLHLHDILGKGEFKFNGRAS
ncbi:KpsF/GutQ family sugar-phosphate isomerase [Desulfatirhabdium butyrativorans]|uniref:KpsF/GutQ family sugar-phosphate isomerase n=1 Tax=Desulfatirhabdium butyrativorans TaxID=340467 RepID=UPI0003FFF699|nr:KpsF/GutQ family sugar-phosphate isomerase [Desulfatirhabdium butyrativorans]